MSGRESRATQRDFERFPLDFPVEIIGKSRSGEPFSDGGKMSNVSGSGLCFSTAHAHWYAVGQKVTVHIFMPGTDELDASMASDARVIWIHFPEQQKCSSEEKALIGIAMDGCLDFAISRIDPE